MVKAGPVRAEHQVEMDIPVLSLINFYARPTSGSMLRPSSDCSVSGILYRQKNAVHQRRSHRDRLNIVQWELLLPF
ncbi:hypothetical protein T12_9467 [Trichinella patagoniensis]|uniref:Uncharacterized protein n=1 Tax=Trichinella patagoniensis TaxID=990121 RepID=A0A0V0ZTM3_9BILA|nr:hypothetical protein T12_9467 [Trichinella patagoniensis]